MSVKSIIRFNNINYTQQSDQLPKMTWMFIDIIKWQFHMVIIITILININITIFFWNTGNCKPKINKHTSSTCVDQYILTIYLNI